jgi:2-polyprenyl-6-hydroxyphenyl methylase / 3-demethylubiquinone-9 3-methyltransferase
MTRAISYFRRGRTLQRVTQQIYDRIDNDLYDSDKQSWWQPDSALYLIQCSLNPARVGYLKRKLFEELGIDPRGKSALEVGCGGGMLCEEIARLGFETTGIDPSERSLQVARDHATLSGLRITYRTGSGEALPYPDGAFDVAFCCDVLEHVRDLPRVISEISRVLKPGGVFCYDTINRTWRSKLVAIKISQVWKRWAFLPANLHVWEMFIRPEELKLLLGENDLIWQEHRGLEPNLPLVTVLGQLRRRARGDLNFRDLGAKLHLVETGNTGMMYLGYAIKGMRNG